MKDKERKAMFANLSNPKLRTGRKRKNPKTVKAKKRIIKTKKVSNKVVIDSLRSQREAVEDDIKFAESESEETFRKGLKKDIDDALARIDNNQLDFMTEAEFEAVENALENMGKGNKTIKKLMRNMKIKSKNIWSVMTFNKSNNKIDMFIVNAENKNQAQKIISKRISRGFKVVPNKTKELMKHNLVGNQAKHLRANGIHEFKQFTGDPTDT